MPEVSYGGEVIYRESGSAAAGTQLRFVRTSGAELLYDTVVVSTDANGFFQLRVGAHEPGTVRGDLTITPPAPLEQYTIRGVAMQTNSSRGDGGTLGRLVADPYLQVIVETLEAGTFARVPRSTVVVREVGGPMLDVPEWRFETDGIARFVWVPKVLHYGPVRLEFTVKAPDRGYTVPLQRTIIPAYMDGPPQFMILELSAPRMWYVGEVWRRGTGERLPGVTVIVDRKSGPAVTPAHYVTPAQPDGRFEYHPTPGDYGEVVADVTLIPPAPFVPETRTGVRFVSMPYDTLRHAGFFGFGPAVDLRIPTTYRATGLPVEEGVHAVFRRTSGLTFVYPPGFDPSGDSGIRPVDASGNAQFSGATTDTGRVVFDVEYRLHYPNPWDTVRNVRVPSRRSDIPFVTPAARVGIWYPWDGTLTDASTGAAVSGAQVRFERVSGARIADDRYATTTDATGRFRIRPVPLDTGDVLGRLSISAAGYRDTVVTPVKLTPFADDTIRSLGVVRLSH